MGRRSRAAQPLDTDFLDSLSPEDISQDESLTEQQLSYLSSLEGIRTQEAVAAHPNTGTAALEYLVRFSHSQQVIRSVLSKPDVRRSTYEAIYDRPKFRATLASVHGIPPDIMDRLLSDPSPKVRTAAQAVVGNGH